MGSRPEMGPWFLPFRLQLEQVPVVVGKPNTPSVEAAIERFGSQRPLIVGDRLDTDIEAAQRANIESARDDGRVDRCSYRVPR